MGRSAITPLTVARSATSPRSVRSPNILSFPKTRSSRSILRLPLVPGALLSCAIPTGYGSAVNRAHVRGGDTVVVIGAGGIGTGAIQGARINGAAQIIAVDPVERKQKSALEFGATHTAATADEVEEMVRDLTRGVMADGVVVSPSLISSDDVYAALKLTRKGGTCVLTGMTPQTTRSIKIPLQEFILWNKNLVGTVFGSCNPRADIPRFARMYDAGPVEARRDGVQTLPARRRQRGL